MSDSKPESITVTFLTNHEVRVENYDLRYTRKREDLINQLKQAADPCGNPQKPVADRLDALLEYRERIREVKVS